MEIRKCTGCNLVKPISEYHKKLDSFDTKCNTCISERDKLSYIKNKARVKERASEYHKTKIGLIVSIHSNQKSSSIQRGHEMPLYSRIELSDWMLSKDEFHVMFKEWEDSGFNSELTPSIDRINDYLGYSFENIRITTWKLNRDRAHSDRKNGINKKGSASIVAIHTKTNIKSEYPSMRFAERILGINHTLISKCCMGIYSQAGGYKFLLKD